MSQSLGLCIYPRPDNLPDEIMNEYKQFSTSNVGDALGRLHTMSGLQHFNNPGVHMVGSALTVRTVAGDNLMIHKAIDVAMPGDVIVVESEGNISRALIGELMCMTARKKGVAGFVIDGAIRDAEDLRQLGLPVYAKGRNPAGPFKNGPGELHAPITCAGARVNPGDIILGDDDGIVVIPKENAQVVIELTKKVQNFERDYIVQLENGTLDRSWVDRTLKEKGCLIIS